MAALETRILARSCGEAEAVEVAPVFWDEPVTKSTPERVRIAAAPRTATNTAVIIGR